MTQVVSVLSCRAYGEWAGASAFQKFGGTFGLQLLVARALQQEEDGVEAASALALCAKHSTDTKMFVKHGGLQVFRLSSALHRLTRGAHRCCCC